MTSRSKKRAKAKKPKSILLRKCKHECGRPCADNRMECNTCRSRETRARNPISYAYFMLKKSAKNRRIKFTITMDWFRKFIAKTDYMEQKGQHLYDHLTIDRIENDKGYEAGNLQVLTRRDNSIKYWQDYRDKKKKEEQDNQGNTTVSYESDPIVKEPIKAPF